MPEQMSFDGDGGEKRPPVDTPMSVPFTAGSETSHEAAERMEPHVDTCRWEVLNMLRSHHPEGLTDEQQQVLLAMNPSTQRTRRKELERLGWVRDSGRIGLTSAGRRAVIWEAVL